MPRGHFSIIISILLGCHSHIFAEITVEASERGIAAIKRAFKYALFCIFQKVARLAYPISVNKGHEGSSCYLSEIARKIRLAIAESRTEPAQRAIPLIVTLNVLEYQMHKLAP